MYPSMYTIYFTEVIEQIKLNIMQSMNDDNNANSY